MKRLRELRKSQNLTLQELSKILNISHQVISRYELGEREADYETTHRIAQFFDVSIDYLLGFSDYFYPDKVKGHSELQYSVKTEKEKALLAAFNNLLPETQNFVLQTVQSLQDGSGKKINK